MTTEVAVHETAVGDALPASAIRAQVDLIQHVMKEVMIKDTHFGIIPGTPKPSLYKPGAEKLCLTFRLDPQYESTKQFVGEHLFIDSTCTLYHQTTGRRLGSGQGSCSTKESKYAYRKGQRVCPKCGKESIIKGRTEYGGGWLCYEKKGGCKAKWPDGAKEIEDQNTERIPNEDLADQYNTVLKMANKRSLIAAVLNVTGASDIFTQDIEDLPEFTEKKPQRTGAEMMAERDAQEPPTELETQLRDSLKAQEEKKGRQDKPVDGAGHADESSRTGSSTAGSSQQASDAPAQNLFEQSSAVVDHETNLDSATDPAGAQAAWDDVVKDTRLGGPDRARLYARYQKIWKAMAKGKK